MSTLRVYNIENPSTAAGGIGIATDGSVTVGGLQQPTAGPLSNRNLIINGAMVFDQRNSGSSVTPTGNTYALDRWQTIADASSKYSVQQVSDAPAGFSFSQKVTSLSAYTPASTELFGIWQWVEGFNSAQLEFGTASAKTITVSFWVKSSLTGTFGGGILNSGYTRGYPFEYTISSANTWEHKTVTITGDTSGTWIGATNGQGLLLNLTLGAGSARANTAGAWSGTQYSFSATGAVNVVSTDAATWQITGVQLEVGSKATPFEHRSYGDELQRCQRYYYKHAEGSASDIGNGAYYSSSLFAFTVRFPVTMRTPPDLDYVTGSNYYRIFRDGSFNAFSAMGSAGRATENTMGIDTSTGTNGTPGHAGLISTNNASAYIGFDAEL